jgi:hypothetical protein
MTKTNKYDDFYDVDDDESGWEEAHGNNPRCTKCNIIIPGKVYYITLLHTGTIIPYCEKCYKGVKKYA